MNKSFILKENPFETLNTIKIQKLKPEAQIPTRGSEEAAGYDLYACIEAPVTIFPHCTTKIGTGIAMELPRYTFGAIFARSGLATKEGLRPANCVGVCDSDYRGEYIVPLHNDTEILKIIKPGDRIAQLVVLPYLPFNFLEVENLNYEFLKLYIIENKTHNNEWGFPTGYQVLR